MTDEIKFPTCAGYVEETRRMHNHICISGSTDLPCRLLGIHFDESDVYYVVGYPAKGDEEASITCESMVGYCESMKGVMQVHDNLDEAFTRRDCPPRAEFTVTADTREEFGRAATLYLEDDDLPEIKAERLADALAHYDRDIAPLLAANAPGIAPPSPWQANRAATDEAVALLDAAHPGYAPAIAQLHWDGVVEGVDTYRNFPGHGKVVATFDRASGTLQGPDWDRSNGKPIPEWTTDPVRVLGQFMPVPTRKSTAEAR